VLSTGDIKFRATTEFLSGWVKLNGLTVGNAVSGATQRANADTQAAFIYLWTNCPNPHCPVLGGRGGSGLADFNANKQISVPDWRGRTGVGVDDMGNSAAGRLAASNVTSGGGDTTTTANATGGEALHQLTGAELATHVHAVFLNDPGHFHTYSHPPAGAQSMPAGATYANGDTVSNTSTVTTGITVRDQAGGAGNANQTGSAGSGNGHNTMPPFMLGTWYLKL